MDSFKDSVRKNFPHASSRDHDLMAEAVEAYFYGPKKRVIAAEIPEPTKRGRFEVDVSILLISPITGNGFAGGVGWSLVTFFRMLPALVGVKEWVFVVAILVTSFLVGFNLS